MLAYFCFSSCSSSLRVPMIDVAFRQSRHRSPPLIPSFLSPLIISPPTRASANCATPNDTASRLKFIRFASSSGQSASAIVQSLPTRRTRASRRVALRSLDYKSAREPDLALIHVIRVRGMLRGRAFAWITITLCETAVAESLHVAATDAPANPKATCKFMK